VDWSQKIFKKHDREDFEDLAHTIFQYQIKHCSVYSDFVNALDKTNPSSIEEIPFLPISFFKSKNITSDECLNKTEMTFKSSGTQGVRSQHFVKDISIYECSFNNSFEFFVGKPDSFVILGLLPNYIEQGDSSLIYMVSNLMEKSGSKLSRFILGSTAEIPRLINEAKGEGRQVLLFGVSYSLLDLMELDIDLSSCIVIETGGMKGRRKELSKSEMHQLLKKELNISRLYSEYGMTELLSQGYCKEDLVFHTPSWMKVFFRDVSDPFALTTGTKSSGLNIIDLANVYSCSFIASDDLGIKCDDGFKIIGRIQNTDIRGCNLLIE
jgi:hypothetical protein